MIGVWLVWFAAEDNVILRFNPALLFERLSPPKQAKSWDRTILSMLRLVRYRLLPGIW